eukprot:3862449-Rhodomonas_salina.3
MEVPIYEFVDDLYVCEIDVDVPRCDFVQIYDFEVREMDMPKEDLAVCGVSMPICDFKVCELEIFCCDLCAVLKLRELRVGPHLTFLPREREEGMREGI